MLPMFNKEAREIRKRDRVARRKANAFFWSINQGPYKGAKVRAEDAGPPPDWPIIGFQKPVKQTNPPPSAT